MQEFRRRLRKYVVHGGDISTMHLRTRSGLFEQTSTTASIATIDSRAGSLFRGSRGNLRFHRAGFAATPAQQHTGTYRYRVCINRAVRGTATPC